MNIKILCCLTIICSTTAGSMQQHTIHSLALKLATEKFTMGSILYIPDNHEIIKHVLKNFIFTIQRTKAQDPTLEIAIRSPESKVLIHSFTCPLLPHAISSASFFYDNQEFTASVSPIVLETRSKSPSPY
jgi:hypothetical protein